MACCNRLQARRARENLPDAAAAEVVTRLADPVLGSATRDQRDYNLTAQFVDARRQHSKKLQAKAETTLRDQKAQLVPDPFLCELLDFVPQLILGVKSACCVVSKRRKKAIANYCNQYQERRWPWRPKTNTINRFCRESVERCKPRQEIGCGKDTVWKRDTLGSWRPDQIVTTALSKASPSLENVCGCLTR